MSDTPTTATPAAASAGLTIEQVNAAIAQALMPVGEALKGLAESHKTLQAGLKAPTEASTQSGTGKAKEEPLTAASVAALVQDGLKAFSAGQSKAQIRNAFAAEKLKDLPKTYQDLLPDTEDPQVLAKSEQDIRARYKAEVGDKTPAAGQQSNGGGGTPKPVVDVSKLNAVQKIELGIAKATAPK